MGENTHIHFHFIVSVIFNTMKIAVSPSAKLNIVFIYYII